MSVECEARQESNASARRMSFGIETTNPIKTFTQGKYFRSITIENNNSFSLFIFICSKIKHQPQSQTISSGSRSRY